MSEQSDPHAGRSHARPGLRRPSEAEAHPSAQPELRQPRSPAPADPSQRASPLMIFVRYVLPALVVVAGLIAMAFGSDVSLEGGAGLVSAGLAIWLINWLFRIGARGDAEREAEDRAREYFDRYGRWPEGR